MIDFVRRFRNRIEATQVFARKNMARAVQRQRRYYTDNLLQFTEGSLVWLYTPPSGEGVSRKLHLGWTGPWEVIQQVTPTSYRVRSPDSWKKKREVVVGINRMKKFYLPQQRLAQYEASDVPQEELERRGDEQCEDLDLPPLPRRRKGAEEEDSDDDDPGPPPPPRWRRGRIPPPLPAPRLPAPPAAPPPPGPGGGRGGGLLPGAGGGGQRAPRPLPRPPVPSPRRRWPFPDRVPPAGPKGGQLPPTPGTAYDQRRQASQWRPARPDTPGGALRDRLPTLEDFPADFDPEKDEVPSDSTSSSSEFEAEERELRTTARGRPPLALRRLQDSAGWRGAAHQPTEGPGIWTRARARQEEPGEPL